ncbi:MAG: peptidylprolyl isomerase [Chloroflexota bacterium]
MPKYDSYPDMVIDPAKNYVAHIETSKGTIKVQLFADKAPKTVNNFVFLAREKFYDGGVFHRVINNFMIQGGDPTGTGRGGPGYKWDDEASALAIPHEKGSLSMANAGKNTNGSQFFITHAPQPHLNGNHAVFGKVVSDEDQKVVDAIEQRDLIDTITIVES